MSGSLIMECNVCGESRGLKRCGFCKVKFYCSREHQMKDWPAHKIFCQNKRKELEKLNQDGITKEISGGNNQNDTDVEDKTANKLGTEISRTGLNETKGVAEDKLSVENSDENGNDGAGKTRRRNGVPFDTRPYLPVKPICMAASSCDLTIAKIALENMNAHGYCVMDGVFHEKAIDKALRDFHKFEEIGRFQTGKLAGGRTSGEEDKKVVNAGIRSDKIVWVEGDEMATPGVRDVMKKLDHILLEFNELLNGKYDITNRTKAMMACYPGNGAYYKRHVDNPNKDGRLVTCILYLNKNWNPEKDGGTLRILPSGTDSYVDIAPLANRLLFFWSDRRNPHEVHPAFRTRYAVTVWYMDKTEREQAQLDHLHEEIDKVRGSEKLFALKETIERHDKLTKQIEDTTSKAVASLTQEELEAIGSIVNEASDPREVLTALGVYPAIQGKLLERLKQLEITP